VNIEQVKAAPFWQCEDQVLQRSIPLKRDGVGIGRNRCMAPKPERLHESMPDSALFDYGRARENCEIVHIGRPYA
jgi:hypothetical protein